MSYTNVYQYMSVLQGAQKVVGVMTVKKDVFVGMGQPAIKPMGFASAFLDGWEMTVLLVSRILKNKTF